ncbi:MAG: hypothetical protein ISP90_03370 [Nevskia sp.]|nr:hypothetical protein [Nevskia sp.]
MFNPLQKTMVGHAALVMVVAMCAGVGLMLSLLGGIELVPGHITEFAIPGNTPAWARAHVGGILNSLLVIALALVLPGLEFSGRAAARLGWLFVGTGWANTVFYWAALFAPNRALSLGPNRFGESNLAAVIGFVPALLFAVLALAAMAVIARKAFSGRG